jgi:type VI protein secretion system component Hcp
MSAKVESAKAAELTFNELEAVSGGMSFEYSTIKWTYVQQKSDGGEPAPKPNR